MLSAEDCPRLAALCQGCETREEAALVFERTLREAEEDGELLAAAEDIIAVIAMPGELDADAFDAALFAYDQARTAQGLPEMFA